MPTFRPLYHRVTEGVRITARPRFVAEQSQPALGHFVFAYRIRLENVGDRPARLLSRRWLIHDTVGEDTQVAGEGVVGEQPLLAPGGVYEYQSFCVLRTPQGWMEGCYHFVRPDGEGFDALIPRFGLDANGVGRSADGTVACGLATVGTGGTGPWFC